MADQKNRGGKKQGQQKPGQSQQRQGNQGTGVAERPDQDKREDQRTNPDDQTRRATNEQR